MSGNNDNNALSTSPTIPKWIEAKLFEKVLKEVEIEFKEIKSFKIEPALGPGENYASYMLKIEFVIKLNDDTLKHVDFMLKVGQDSELYREMVQAYDVFDIEKGMYQDIIPEIEEMLMKVDIKVRFGAKTYTLPTTEPHILMENLKTQGFRNANRLDGLDVEHMESVLKKMAQWHAASAVRVARKGTYLEKYAKGYLKPESHKLITEMYGSTTNVLLECVRQYSNAHLYYDKVEKMQYKLTENLYKTVAEAADNDEEFKVLNHGDIWSNNIMFQYDKHSGNLIETYFVDYQMPLYTSPALDVLYFIMSSSKYEIKLERFDYMIAFYYKQLREVLTLLKYPKRIPTLRDVQCTMYKNGIWDESLKPISFMLKICHDSELFRQMLEGHNVFDVEAGMYRHVIPEIEKILSDAGMNVRFGAKTYTLPTEEPYILLENLKVHGFRNTKRQEGLDMVHIKSVLKKLAQWHAATAVRVATKGKFEDKYATGYLKPDAYDMIKGMFDNATAVLLESVREFTDSNIYYEKVVKLQNQITDELFKEMGIGIGENEDEFKVLNHGDAWSNNIMFQYNEDNGDLKETYFVDYQIPSYTSPAQDLWYFIISSCKYEIKLANFDYVLAYYHQQLDECLRLLKYPKKMPMLKDIHCMMYTHGVWAYATATNVMAAVLCDPTDKANLDNFISETDAGLAFKRQMYSNPRYRKHMEALLPWLLNRGLLEC
ncbi:uncharacterized protein LOC106087290 [Stomoxys calcitrans]|uniref:uncharacterized protein LOC106087290 n=1 Tax=Stomoxys calcitrans TaxID=35570 RepID=UPI0027E2814C|nr:uncharacterized protein LOC106087290 [Stomoxys calcitrans]